MGDPIINAQVDDINATLGNIKVDLAALRPSIRAIRDAIAETYLTDTIENVPIASFNDGADDIPVRELQVAIEPVQSGSGDPSPTNIRPISGHTEVKVARAGRNLIVVDMLDLPTTNSGIKSANGEIISSSASRYTHGYIPVNPSTSYSIVGKLTSSNSNSAIYEYDAGKNWIEKKSLGARPAPESIATFTTSETTHFIQIQYVTAAADFSAITLAEGMLTESLSQLGEVSTISLGQTVYGGTLNVTTGVLTIDRAMVTFNGSETWTKSGSALNGYYTRMDSTQSTFPAMRFGSSLISDKFVYTASSSQYFNNYGYCYADGTIGMNVDPSVAGGNTLATFKTWLAANPTQFVYYLATPTTVQLTATEIESLFGANNVWSDSGNVVKLTYRKAWEIALAQGE